VDGLKGAGVALLVLIASILACQGGYKFAHSSSTNWTDQKWKKTWILPPPDWVTPPQKRNLFAPRECSPTYAIKSVTCSRYYSCCSLMPMSFFEASLLLLLPHLRKFYPQDTLSISLYDLVWPLIAFTTISTAYPPTQTFQMLEMSQNERI